MKPKQIIHIINELMLQRLLTQQANKKIMEKTTKFIIIIINLQQYKILLTKIL